MTDELRQRNILISEKLLELYNTIIERERKNWYGIFSSAEAKNCLPPTLVNPDRIDLLIRLSDERRQLLRAMKAFSD